MQNLQIKCCQIGTFDQFPIEAWCGFKKWLLGQTVISFKWLSLKQWTFTRFSVIMNFGTVVQKSLWPQHALITLTASVSGLQWWPSYMRADNSCNSWRYNVDCIETTPYWWIPDYSLVWTIQCWGQNIICVQFLPQLGVNFDWQVAVSKHFLKFCVVKVDFGVQY